MSYRIVAVIVTYNRLELLKEAIEAIKAQTLTVTEIVVVDNSSTDGSGEWLRSQPDLTILTQINSGGSGGFFTGLKYAGFERFDWAWVMDDDTVCAPDTLARLVEKLDKIEEPVGFIGSKSIWTDGSPHLMNIPAIRPSFNGEEPFNCYDSEQLLLVESCSFVSVIINVDAVLNLGLPYREFFIWGDDQEYTKRISKNGYLGLYCIDSVVLHKTPTNYFPDFYRDSVANLWKHSYGFRNEFFIKRKTHGLIYYILWLVIKLIYTSYKLIRIRRSDRRKFIAVLFLSGWRSVFFNPRIEKII